MNFQLLVKSRRLTLIFFLSITFHTLAFTQAKNGDRPNIVWVVSEDNSKHYLQLYEAGGAPMPNIEALAKEGLVFEHAFSNGPVCSVARSTIISGCYAPRVGVQYHRRMQFANLPAGVQMFPAYLKQSGYYTSNNSKEDYNFKKPEGVWNESSRKASYRNRQDGQPFFHVQNFGRSHEGQLHFSKADMETPTTTATNDVDVFPYHPNTPTFRYTHAKYRDLQMEIDQQIGAFIDQLKADGVYDNTIIFYYGDHGGVLPRGKGYIYESGVHVPMVVHFPPKWRHLAPAEPGSRLNGFVQFIDLGPTVLHLAGVKVPKNMDGKPFLGKGVSQAKLDRRDMAFSYADRFDEKYDLVRAIRKGKFKYMRNFQPFNFDGLFNFYRYKMLAYKEWRVLFDEGKLNAAQKQFFETRTPEALYDLEKDPHETNNLAADPVYATTLKSLRKQLNKQLSGMPDLSFLPEPYLVQEGLNNPVQFGQTHKKQLKKLIQLANLQLKPFEQVESALAKALASPQPWQRYWALIVCSTFGAEATSLYAEAKNIAENDAEPLVRMRAAEFLGLAAQIDPMPVLTQIFYSAKDETTANLILNTVTLMLETDDSWAFEVKRQDVPANWIDKPNDLVNRRLEYIEKF